MYSLTIPSTVVFICIFLQFLVQWYIYIYMHILTILSTVVSVGCFKSKDRSAHYICLLVFVAFQDACAPY
jgi:hypothetical protein